MPTGSLKLEVTDLLDDGVEGNVRILLRRAEGGPGSQEGATFPLAGETVLTLEDITCQAGFGTTYTVTLTTNNFRRYAFNQLIKEKVVNKANESPVRLVVKPKSVLDIKAPSFLRLAKKLRDFLSEADMRKPEDEDADLFGLSGAALYDNLGPLRKACLLNIFKKAGHTSSDGCDRFMIKPLALRQDRCFCLVHEDIVMFLNDSTRFTSVNGALHDPLRGFQMLKGLSYKSTDSHANLQVTLMKNATGRFAADVDIDEASGIGHGFEVIRNKIGNQRTNPFLVRELLLLHHPAGAPRYRFVFK